MSHAQLMLGSLQVNTRVFNDGSQAPEYALISWQHHAYLFLSAPGTGEGLRGLVDEVMALIQKINLKWAKSRHTVLGRSTILGYEITPSKGVCVLYENRDSSLVTGP